MSVLLEAALAYAQRGWRVFPLHGIVNGACTCGGKACSSAGKHPLVRRGLYEATVDVDQVQSWWSRWRSANIGIATGAASGIVVIDVDLPAALMSIDTLLGRQLPATLTGLTGGGGVHLVYASDDGDLGNSVGGLPGAEDEFRGIDLRANGGYIVAPPSVHRSGRFYQWLNATSSLAPAPCWLRQPERSSGPSRRNFVASLEGEGTPYGLAALQKELECLQCAPVGTRNHQLNRSAFALAQLVAGGELMESVARASLLDAALGIGLGMIESRRTVGSAFEAGCRSPRVAPHRSLASLSTPGSLG